MDVASATAIVQTTVTSLSDTLAGILPAAIPTLIVVGLLFWAVRKFVHNG